MMYSKALIELAERLPQENILLVVQFKASVPFWCKTNYANSASESATVVEATYVDDEAIASVSKSPKA